MEGIPLIHGTTPGEHNQASHDGANEDEIADYVDASELLFSPSLALIIDVQEDEETCKCDCRSQ